MLAMKTMTDLLTHAEVRRRARVREEYQRRVEGLPEPLASAEEAPWPTPETIRELQSVLRLAATGQALGVRHVLRFLSLEYLQLQTRALSEDLLARQQSTVIEAPPVEEQIPLPQVSARLAAERKRVVRELLDDATTTAISGHHQAYRRLWSRLFGVAESLGYPNLIALWEELSGVDLEAFLKRLAAILRETEYTYREAMQWYLKRVFGIQLEAARRHDILALFGMGLQETEAWFPRSQLIPCLEQWLSDWGWKIEDHINVRLERHAALAGGAWCASFDIPADVRLALAPMAGMRGFAQAFREAGKALLLASFPAEAATELRCFPDPSLLEAQAEVFGGLMRARNWLDIQRHIHQPGDVLRLAHLERLFIVRRYIGKCLYERTLYEDAALEGIDEVYRDALRRACGFSYPPAYYLYDVEPGFATLWHVRGWLLSAHLRRQLQQQYPAEWFREPNALEACRELWSQSPYHTVEALGERVGGSSADVMPVVDDLLSEL
jgi:hypothetical protein